MPKPLHGVFLSPGLRADSNSPKILALAEVARSKGCHVEIVDYTGIPNPEHRVAKLLQSKAAEFENLVLAGISMGGYVSAVAAETLTPRGLFLVSPALYLEPYANMDPQPKADKMAVIHGWNDALVPPENVYRFARRFRAAAYFIDGDHSLNSYVSYIAETFGGFLDGLG